MKIPTILALIILSILIMAGVWTRSYLNQIIKPQKDLNTQQINQSNLSPNSVSLSWITPSPTNTRLIFTTDKNFLKDLKSVSDQRGESTQNRTLHFVTLEDLSPNTTYYFKIEGAKIDSQQFTTPAENQINETKFPPLVGSVVDNSLQKITDALITLEIPDFLPLSTYSTANGNFVLPIKPIYSKNLTQIIDLSQKPEVSLVITKNNLVSHIDLYLTQDQSLLPPIILGQNLDLRDYQSTPSSSAAPNYNFDINNDGKINSTDEKTVQNNIGKTKFAPKADINLDGVVDQKDLDLILGAIQNP